MSKKFFISCDEATTICDKSQYGEASFLEKLKLQFHFIQCKLCALYSRQNTLITKIVRQKSNQSKAQTNCLSQEDKEALRKELEQIDS